MEYKNSYGKKVMVDTDTDLAGNKMNQELDHVVTFYVDSDSEVVGIYPIEPETGYTQSDLLSFQPVKHQVFTHDLTEIKG